MKESFVMKNNVIYVDFIFSHRRISYVHYRFTYAFYFIFRYFEKYLNKENKIPKKSLPKKYFYKVSNHLKL